MCSLGDMGYYFWYTGIFSGKHRRRRQEQKEKKTTEGRHEREGECVRAADGWRGEGDSPPGPSLDSRRNLTRVPRLRVVSLIWIPPFVVFRTLSPLKPCFFSLPKGTSKGYEREKWIPHLPSLPFSLYIPPSHLSSLSLSLGLKGLCFQRKRLHTKGGNEGEKKEKKISSSFLCFSPKTAAVSHIASPIHTLTP